MEFRRYLKERLSQLRENEALNVTEISSEGRGIRKVKFNPETARSLIPIPYHKKIVVNKNLKGLDLFLHLQGDNREKIEKIYRTLKGSRIFSPRKDRDNNPPGQVLDNPPTVYFYGNIYYYSANTPWNGQFNGYIFVKVKDKFYNVYHYDSKNKSWSQNFVYRSFGKKVEDNSQIYVDDETVRLEAFPSGEDHPSGITIKLKIDFLGDGDLRQLNAESMFFEYDWGNRVYWFCKQLDGPLPNKIYYGDEAISEVYNNCYYRGISI